MNGIVAVVAWLILLGGAVGLVVGAVNLDGARAAWSFGQLAIGAMLVFISRSSRATPHA
jgi:hypothetical protein